MVPDRAPGRHTGGRFRDSNLHVLNYSGPIDATVSLDELREHVFTHPDDPELVPYRTSYYAERCFCMSRRSSTRFRPGTTGSSSIRRSRPEPSATERPWFPAGRRTRCYSPRTPATRPSRTTTSGVALLLNRDRTCTRGAAGAPLHLSPALGAGDDRVDLLARPEARHRRAGSPRPRRVVRRRSRPVHVQAQPPGRH